MAGSKSIPLLLRSARATPSSPISSTICPSCRSSLASRLVIPSVSSRRQYADDKSLKSGNLMEIFGGSRTSAPTPAPIEPSSIIPGRQSSGLIFEESKRTAVPSRLGRGAYRDIVSTPEILETPRYPKEATILDPWGQLFHLHVYSTKHNTHITFTDPKRNAIISSSTGILGFRKAGRHSYDAAYQLAAHVFQKIEDKGLIPKKVEVVLRGFGIGREAVVKALLGKEGRYIKDVVVRVTDATRTKFGGTRSKNKRRL
ncbi:hypothetical protein TWF506_007890 [Arthrobotrys conoides]|uniref:Mitochondrial ribosomal protein subunit S18 n=1 Tax=Arthrobotrys conoides TaxID=74498 RepID=A0AAN8NGC8_9PEZI